jgi:hypothetical protein
MRASDVAAAITPLQIALIFSLKAEGVWQQDIACMVNTEMPNEIQITEHIVRMVLHRREPFDAPRLYSLVDPSDAEAVLDTFKSRGPNKQRARQKPDTATTPILDNVDQTAAVLAKVLKARMDYDKAMHEAKALGFSCDAVKAWISMATGGDLQ